jgi:heat shock protein HslJ
LERLQFLRSFKKVSPTKVSFLSLPFVLKNTQKAKRRASFCFFFSPCLLFTPLYPMKKKQPVPSYFSFLLLALLLFLSACAGSKKKTSKEASAPLMGTTWKITKLEGVQTLPTSGKGDIFVLFQEDAKTLRGFAGCNNFSGLYQTDQTAKTISISGLMTTKMACPLLKFEYDYLGKLEKATRYEIVGKKLWLYQEQTLLATFEATLPIRP